LTKWVQWVDQYCEIAFHPVDLDLKIGQKYEKGKHGLACQNYYIGFTGYGKRGSRRVVGHKLKKTMWLGCFEKASMVVTQLLGSLYRQTKILINEY